MLLEKPLKTIPYVVLADDDSTGSFRFQELLNSKKIPYIFYFASNSEMLFKVIDEQDFVPDIILFDLRLSDITGIDCMEALKTRKCLNKVPVIVYSESADAKDKDYCYNTKPSEYFSTALEYLI